MKKYSFYFLLAFAVIGIDQAIKLLVHFNMDMGANGQIKVFGNWFKIHYILNPGMAFGLDPKDFLGGWGKLILTAFRIVATILITLYIKYLVDNQKHKGLIICMTLILAGALGNVLDSTFYGIFLKDNVIAGSPFALFHGQVVDMIYVDIWEGELPKWLPLIGGKYYSFWPIFNIADSSIFVGVMVILFRNEAFFRKTIVASEPTHENLSAETI